LESQLNVGLLNLTERSKLHFDVWRTSFDNRLCALEGSLEGSRRDLDEMNADFENRFFALEGRLAALPGLRQLQQHTSDLKQDVARTKTDVEVQRYQLEDQLGVLRETIDQHQVAHNEDIANLKAILEDKVAVVKKDINNIHWMQIEPTSGITDLKHESKPESSNLSVEKRLGTSEGSVGLSAPILRTVETKLSGVLRQVPKGRKAGGSNIGLNERSASSSSIMRASHGALHRTDMTYSRFRVTQD